MKISYDVKMTAQNVTGREYSVIQHVEHDDGTICRNCLYTSSLKGNKGMLECYKMIQKIRLTF